MLLTCLITFLFAAVAIVLSFKFRQEKELLLVTGGLFLIIGLILIPGPLKFGMLLSILGLQRFISG